MNNSGEILLSLQSDFEVGDDYCGTKDINNPISGDPQYSITSNAAILFPDTLATGIVMTTANPGFTVAFVGISDGALKKVLLMTFVINFVSRGS